AGFYLRAAVEALADDGRPLALTVRPAPDVSEEDIRGADVLLLASVPELADPITDALRERVRGGAGLVIFLGEQIRPPFYNAKLHDPLNPAAGLLPVSLRAPERLPEPVPLGEARWSHRL